MLQRNFNLVLSDDASAKNRRENSSKIKVFVSCLKPKQISTD